MTEARELVLNILLIWEKEGTYYNLILKDTLDKYSYLDRRDRAFIKRLTEGVVERRIELDYVIDSVSKIIAAKMKPAIRNIIRMGVYQILYMDSIPNSASVSESVKLARKKGFNSLSGFVNGVLRGVTRLDGVIYPDGNVDFKKYVSIKYSMPEWLVEHFLGSYDEKTVECICKSFLEEKGTSIRVNESVVSPGELKERLSDKGLNISDNGYLPFAFELSGVNGITDIEEFESGCFTVMDVSSMLVCFLADIKASDLVMDVCAAPGGKSIHAADIMRRKYMEQDGVEKCRCGEVSARDISEKKVALIDENIARIGFDNINTRVFSALDKDEDYVGRADVVICDLPCSGLGVIGRKADIKYRVNKEDLDELAKLQKDMLRMAYLYLKPGGTLMYSTCTIDRAENEENAAFIVNELGMNPVDLRKKLPKKLLNEAEEYGGALEYGVQLLPGLTSCDGFYISRFVKP